jgi:hypothetical protein
MIEELIAEYITLRDARHDLARQDKDLKFMMEALERQMLELANDLNVTSFKTKHGTAFKTTKTYVSVTDRAALERYVLDNNDLGVFTNHVNKAHVVELLETGIDPAMLGVEFNAENVMQFRK